MSPAVIYVGLYWCFHACTLYLLLSLKIRIVFWHLQVVFIDFWFFLYMQDFIDYKLWEQFINGNQYRLTTQYGSNRWHAELLISCPGLQSRSCLAQQVWVAFWFCSLFGSMACKYICSAKPHPQRFPGFQQLANTLRTPSTWCLVWYCVTRIVSLAIDLASSFQLIL